MKTYRAWDVDQSLMFPPSIRELVPAGHLAHFVRDTVRESLDLSAIEGVYSNERGYPPYDPVMMTALLLYAYCQGVFSSRRIARACEERIDVMAVTAMQKPDFRTVSDFRKRHLSALGSLFGQVLKLCQRAGLVKLGHVALDGTKVKANASKHRGMSYDRMKKAEPELAAEVAEWFAKAEAADAADDERVGRDHRGDEMPGWVVSKQKRLEKIRTAMAELEAEAKAKVQEREKSKDDESDKDDDDATSSGKRPGRPPKNLPGVPKDKAQRNFTDPESRIMKGSDGFIQGYNCQAAVDSASQVIVAEMLGNCAGDAPQLDPMLKRIKENTGRQATELSADAGYCSERNLARLNQRHIRAYVATGRQRSSDAVATGRRILVKGTRVHKMAVRLKQGGRRGRYRLRKAVVEPVFGQIKQARGFRQFLLRGIIKVAEEWRLICTAHNFLKLAAALG